MHKVPFRMTVPEARRNGKETSLLITQDVRTQGRPVLPDTKAQDSRICCQAGLFGDTQRQRPTLLMPGAVLTGGHAHRVGNSGSQNLSRFSVATPWEVHRIRARRRN